MGAGMRSTDSDNFFGVGFGQRFWSRLAVKQR